MNPNEVAILSLTLVGVILLATQVFEKPKLKTYKLEYACDPDGDPNLIFPFCNTSLSDSERVNDLISRLTVHEKITQLVSTAFNVSRLGIPAYEWWGEGLHGVAISPSVHFGGTAPSATSFPLPILTASSYNTTLWNKIGQVTSTEGRAIYNQGRSGLTYWSPNINIARDPRWGRTQETPGEDPKLSSTYAAYFVKGMQEGEYDGTPATEMRGPRRLKLSACCKHFTAHDLDAWKSYDRNHFDAKVTQQDLEDTYNPPFKSCVKDGQSSSLMCSYNRLNGIPMCTDYELLTATVRNQWGFDGYIMSDCDAVALIHEFIDYAPTPEDAVSDVMLAGMDLNCGTTTLYHAQKALARKLISEELIDTHLRNLFSVRMRLGMFDGNPSKLPYGLLGPADVCTDDNQHLALEAARQSIVLLKNDKNILPWKRSSHQKVAIIGPHANATREMLGDYEGYPCKFISPLKGLSTLLAGDSNMVLYEPGCYDATCDGSHLIPAAKSAASRADAVILVVGISQAQEKEGRDRMNLLLPGRQHALVNAVLEAASGRPIVLVILSGGPLDVSFANNDKRIQSIIWAGYPGQAGGQALAEIIYGDVNPGGRLPLSWYYNNYTEVDMSNMNMRPNASSGYPGRTYRFFTGPTLWEFGYGLSYTEFSQSFVSAPATILAPSLRHQLCHSETAVANSTLDCLEAEKGKAQQELAYFLSGAIFLIDHLFNHHPLTGGCEDSSFNVSVRVKNNGPMHGAHSVLLFAKPPMSGINGTPLKQLVNFQRVLVASDTTHDVVFKLNPCTHLTAVGEDGMRRIPLGKHTLMVGAASHSITVEWNSGHGQS